MTRPSSVEYDVSHRLHLPHPCVWTVAQAKEARDCTGCVVQVTRGVRYVHTLPGCPVHTKAA